MLPSVAAGTPGQNPTVDLVVCGSIALDPQGWSVTVNGRAVSLTVSEFLLLQALVRRPYRFVDRNTLDQALRSKPGPTNCAKRASLRSIDVIVWRLRRKLHDADCDAIESLRKVGYRFVPGQEPALAIG